MVREILCKDKWRKLPNGMKHFVWKKKRYINFVRRPTNLLQLHLKVERL